MVHSESGASMFTHCLHERDWGLLGSNWRYTRAGLPHWGYWHWTTRPTYCFSLTDKLPLLFYFSSYLPSILFRIVRWRSPVSTGSRLFSPVVVVHVGNSVSEECILIMEAIRSSETLVTTCKLTRRRNWDDHVSWQRTFWFHTGEKVIISVSKKRWSISVRTVDPSTSDHREWPSEINIDPCDSQLSEVSAFGRVHEKQQKLHETPVGPARCLCARSDSYSPFKLFHVI
jgi:hypothetical protein